MDPKQKEYGDLKIVHHPAKLEALRKGIITAPIYVRIKPTNVCNHDCFYCVYESSFSGIHADMSRKDSIPKEKMMEILEDLNDLGVKSVTYSGGGEPLTYPHIIETLGKTLDYGLKLSMITNGQKLSEERARLLADAFWVRVSADSCNSQTFHETRRRPEEWFPELVSNIENFARIKSPKTKLGINFVVNEKNHTQVYSAARFFRELGANNIKFSAVWNPDLEAYHRPFKESVIEQIAKAKQEINSPTFRVYSTYEKDFESTGVPDRCYDRCFYSQITPAIGADQVVYFCHNKAYDPEGALGSIRDKSFRDLWFSREAAKRLRTFNPQKGCRHQCTNDTKNALIWDIISCYGDHIDFP
ncbi:MAG: radical SAM protein [archaeon]|nr:radical SAM protein [archaeon]